MAQTKVVLVEEIRQYYEITSISQETVALQNLSVVLVQYKIKERKKKRKGS